MPQYFAFHTLVRVCLRHCTAWKLCIDSYEKAWHGKLLPFCHLIALAPRLTTCAKLCNPISCKSGSASLQHAPTSSSSSDSCTSACALLHGAKGPPISAAAAAAAGTTRVTKPRTAGDWCCLPCSSVANRAASGVLDSTTVICCKGQRPQDT